VRSVDDDGAADQRWIGSESSAPERLADDDDLIAAWLLFFEGEFTALRHRAAEE
jgi:hypothetical protein